MDKKKISIQDLQNAKTPEDLKRMLEESGGEFQAVIPDNPVDIKEYNPRVLEMPEDGTIEESMLVPPDEVERRKKQIVLKDEDALPRLQPSEMTSKAVMRAGKVAISYETGGRFDTPEIGYFSDYTVQDINDIALSRTEDILENIVVILDKNKEDDSWSVQNMLLEEFYETLVAMKIQFNKGPHTHRWICKCQEDIPDHRRKPSEQMIDLENINYVSIEQCDEDVRSHFREIFKNISDEQFTEYLTRKYGDSYREYTREDEVEKIKVSEPVVIKDEQNTYEFEFSRVRHLLKALRISQKKFNWKIRNKKNENVKGQELEARKKDELELLENEKAKYTILVIRALTLLSFDGKKITTDDEKINIFRNMKRNTMMKLATVSDRVKFGIQDEREFTCNLSGCGISERRLLQREISPVELLPLDNSGGVSSARKPQDSSELDIYFGTIS